MLDSSVDLESASDSVIALPVSASPATTRLRLCWRMRRGIRIADPMTAIERPTAAPIQAKQHRVLIGEVEHARASLGVAWPGLSHLVLGALCEDKHDVDEKGEEEEDGEGPDGLHGGVVPPEDQMPV